MVVPKTNKKDCFSVIRHGIKQKRVYFIASYQNFSKIMHYAQLNNR